MAELRILPPAAKYFKKLKAVPLEEKAGKVKIPLCGGTESFVNASCVPVSASLFDGEEEKISVTISVSPFVFAPVEKGDVLGKAIFSLDGKIIAESPLIAETTAFSKNEKDGLIDRIKDIF